MVCLSKEQGQVFYNPLVEMYERLSLLKYQEGGVPNTNRFIVGRHNTHLFAYDNDGNCETISVLIPSITDVKSIDDKVVIVNFADGTSEKAVLSDNDKFSLEQGISICITKKMLSMETNGNGSSAYNKLINHCLKVYENNRKAEEKAKADEQAAKEKEKKAADKARAKRIKKANKNREREIEIQKEAYLRAMREFGGNPAVND